MKNENQFDSRKTKEPQTFRDLGETHQAVYMGHCVLCGRNVYAERDAIPEYAENPTEWGNLYDPDGRGIIDWYHAVRTLEAWEFGKEGADVLACAECCDGDGEKYKKLMKIAYVQWKDKEDTKNES
jgi:hypothetical protein